MPDLDIGSDVIVSNLVDPPATQSSARGPGAKGWASGVAGIKSAGYGLKAFGANIVGAESVKQQALTDAAALEQQAAADAMRVEDINSVGTAYDWGKYALATALPSILMSIAGGGAGRALGALAARKAVTDSARTMLKDGGMLGGAGAASLGLGVGSIYPEALEEKVDNPALRAVVGGTASAALDVLPGYAFARKVGLIGDPVARAARQAGFGAYAKGAATTAGKGALIEGGTEGVQEGIEAVAAGKDLTDPRVISAMLNAAATGAVAGTAFGAAGGVVDTARTPLAGTEPVLPPADINGPQPVSQPIDAIAADVQRTFDGGAVDLPVLAPEFSPVQGEPPRPVDTREVQPVADRYNRAESPVATDADLNQIDVLSRQRAELDSRVTEIEGKLAEPTTPRRDKVLLEREYTPLKAELDAVNTQIEGLSQGIRNREAMAETPSGAITERTAAAQRQEPVVTEQINDTDTAELAVARQKRERGLLVTKREADLMRAADRAAAAPAAVAVQEAPTFTSREKTKYVNDEARAKVVYDLANQSVEKNFADLPGSGKFTPEVRKKVTNALTAAIDAAATAPTIEASEKQIYDAAIKALAGKVNKDDAETFAQSVAADVRSAPTFYSKGAASDVASVIRNEFSKSPSISLGKAYPITVEFNGRAQQFMARQDSLSRGRLPAPLYLAHVKRGRMIASAPEEWLLQEYKLDGRGNLVENGMPKVISAEEATTFHANFSGTRPSFAALLEDDGTGKPTVESYDAQQLALTDAGVKLTDGLFRIIPHDPNLEVKVYHAETGAPIGYYRRVDKQKSVIALAVNAKEGVSLAMHEGLHYLEDRVLDARERAILNRGLKPGAPLFKRVLERTQQYDRDNKTQITDEVISNPREAHAYGFQFWQRGELQVDGAIAKIFAKLQEFIERIANLINGLGFQSVEDIFRAIDLGQYRTRQTLEAQVQGDLALASEAAAEAPPLTAAFKRWFGNSKVVDAQGNPLVVYHGSPEDIDTFSLKSWGTQGHYFSKDPFYAAQYAGKDYRSTGKGGAVYPAYLSVQNPLVIDGRVMAEHGIKGAIGRVLGPLLFGSKYEAAIRTNKWQADPTASMGLSQAHVKELKSLGYDGIVNDQWNEIVVFDATQIKSAIGNRGTFDPSNPNILYSRAAISPERQAALTDMQRRYEVGELEREQMMDATAASLQHMPDATWKQDIKALAGSVPSGLKRWRLANIASANYISRFSTGYANVQKTLLSYVQRKNNLIAEGVDVMLSEWRASGTAQADIDAVGRAMFARTEKGYLASSPEYAQLVEPLTTKQRKMFDQANNMIADRLRREFEVEQGTMAKLLPQAEYDEWFANRSTQVRKLIAEGYVPERRYGNYTVNIYLPVTGKTGKTESLTVHFERFELEAGAKLQAQRYAAHLAKVAPELRVETGHIHNVERDTSLSIQQFLDTATRYGIALSQAERERIAKALVASDSMRRNRMFRRENVPGYAKDTMRVLAEFAVTMANKVAYSEYSSSINDAIQGRPVDAQLVNGKPVLSTDSSRNLWDDDGPQSGFYQNISDELVDHVLTPALKGEWSRKVRALTMLYFLGGSVAAGVVNMTSLPMNTMPWLSQYTPYTNAFARTSAAWTMTLKNQRAIRDLATLENRDIAIPDVDSIPGLRDALVTAGKDGTTLDTEIYQIMGLTRGGLLAKSKTTQKAVEHWMLPFRFAEQTNRIASFVSAYRIGQDNKLTGRDLYKFAQDAVYNTQFRYDEVNRPALARDPLWAILFTFKSYPLFVVEMLETMYKQNPGSVVVMLLGLSFAAGIEGLPFAEGLMDLVDTISQKLFGSPFNTRRALRNVLKSASEAVIGVDASEVILRGVINEVTGMSIATRVGLGNMIPGTRIGTADTNYGKLMQEIAGPVGAMVQSGAEGVGKLFKGDFLAALRDEGPLAARNLIKGVQQLDRGYAQDAKGRKLLDVTGMEAFWQSLGFSSANLAHAYEADMIDRQTTAFYRQVRDDFTNDITKAIRDGDSAKAQETLDAVTKWNAQYPEMPVSFSPAVMRRNIMLAGMPLNERTLRLLPKQLRASSLAAEGVPQ
jgi:hypothetical protein